MSNSNYSKSNRHHDSINKLKNKFNNKIQSSENGINEDNKLSVVYKEEKNKLILNDNINKNNKSQSQRNKNFSNSIEEINQISGEISESNFNSFSSNKSFIRNNSNNEENKNDNNANFSDNSNINQSNNNFNSSNLQNSDNVNDNENNLNKKNENKKAYPNKFNIDDENRNNINLENSNNTIEVDEEVKKLVFKVRLNFVRKIYAISTVQLTITLLINCLSFIEDIKNYFDKNYILLFVGIFTLISVLVFVNIKNRISQEVPLNYFLVFLFTLSFSVILLFLSSAFSPEKIIVIWGSLIVMTIGIILFSFYLKDRFEFIFAIIVIIIIAILILVMVIFAKLMFSESIGILFCVIASLGAVFFGLFLILHTQLLLTKKIEVDTDKYIISSMQIYSDIVLIFINLLFALTQKLQ